MDPVIEGCYTHYHPDVEQKTQFGILNDTAYNNSA